jgi:hypothetical protein
MPDEPTATATTRRNELMTQTTFSNVGEFKAMQAAEDWCAEQGISVGPCQRGDPRGLLRGDFYVAKWRNLSEDERAALDGLMTGDMRNGPVIVGLWVKP